MAGQGATPGRTAQVTPSAAGPDFQAHIESARRECSNHIGNATEAIGWEGKSSSRQKMAFLSDEAFLQQMFFGVDGYLK